MNVKRQKRINAFRFLSVAFFSFFMACTTRLDINPAFDIPEDRSLEDAVALQELLETAYSALQSEWCYGAAFTVYPEILADHVKPREEGLQLLDADIYYRRMTPFTEGVNKTWEWSYKAINRANLVIDAIETNKVPNLSTSEKNRFLGEGLFIRAITHFELVRLYAPQYDATTLGAPAIPLRLTPSKDKEGSSLATVGQVYEQIIADLNRAVTLLPDMYTDRNEEKFFGRGDKVVAKAFLALVHFQKGTEGYEAALPLIDEVLGVDETFAAPNFNTTYPPNSPVIASGYPGADLLTPIFGTAEIFKTVVTQSPNKFELIFVLMNIPGNSTYISLLKRFGYFSVPKFGITTLLPQYVVSDSALAQMRKHTSFNLENFDKRMSDARTNPDLRLLARVNGQYFTNKYSRQLEGNVVVLRAAELLLARAEIHAANGRLVEAKRDMGALIQRSIRVGAALNNYLAAVNAITDKNVLLEEIYRERVRELNFEGKRLHDLRRRKVNIGAGNRGGGELPWNAAELILPIPNSETSTNKNLR